MNTSGLLQSFLIKLDHMHIEPHGITCADPGIFVRGGGGGPGQSGKKSSDNVTFFFLFFFCFFFSP